MTQRELDKLVQLHKKWLNGDPKGKKLVLRNVILHNADLRNTDLRSADLHNTDLRNANLRNADLRRVDLTNADLSGATLSGSNLYGANLYDANLRNVVLYDANLCTADLRNTNLHGVRFTYSNLSDTLLDDAERCRLGTILKEPIIGWKKCKNDKIVKLEVPKGAVVFCINKNECRTNRVKVLSVNGSDKETAVSSYSRTFMYIPNETLEVEDFDLRYNVECSSGIHFFRTREEAEEYRF